MMVFVFNEIVVFLVEVIKKFFCGLLVVIVINFLWGKIEKFLVELKVLLL